MPADGNRNSISLKSHFDNALAAHGFRADPAQSDAIASLSKVHAQLCNRRPASSRLAQLKRRLPGKLGHIAPTRGLYMWGSVGRGKTFVMDVFFDALPFDDKLRYHFHRFMYRVHGRLKTLESETEPLNVVADELAAQARIICFDEFFVADIADAMILGKLLHGLFERGVCLVATSNITPDELYRDGLQRQQFLPAIDLIKKHTNVLHVDGSQDYRLRLLEQAELWHSPLDNEADINLSRYFGEIAPDSGTADQSIEILGRDIQTRKRADGIVWFDFDAVCDGPRSQDDYIELARSFQTVVLSNIPCMDRDKEDQARRFIALVDEFYDRRVKLIASAAEPIEKIYKGKRLAGEFQRTVSRLLEMQSHDYLAATHLP